MMKWPLALLLFLSIHLFAQTAPLPSSEAIVCESITADELRNYERLIGLFGKKLAKTDDLKRSVEGFQIYLNRVGIDNFKADEISEPNHPELAQKCNYGNFIPPKCIWSNGAAILSLLEKIRTQINTPILFRNWWRPACYNELVEGAKASDHLLAKSVDVDFTRPMDRALAQKFICDELWKKGENVQIGIGCNSLHIGLGSPKGKRFWVYSSMKNCPVKGIDQCWDVQ